MISDALSEWSKYAACHGGTFARAFEWLEARREQWPAPGRYPVEGAPGMYAIVETYAPKAPAGAHFENHHAHVDIQYLVSGREVIRWTRPRGTPVREAYDPARDIEFFESDDFRAETTPLLLAAGEFAVFWPGDWHMPGLRVQGAFPDLVPGSLDEAVTKVVVKVPVGR